MCNHSLQSPLVRLQHCRPVRQSGLYSACTGIHLIDEAPHDHISVRRTPAHKPTLTSVAEDEEPRVGMSAVVLTFEDEDFASDTRKDEATPLAASPVENEGKTKDPPRAVEPFPAHEDPPATTRTAEPRFSGSGPLPSITSPSSDGSGGPHHPTGAERLEALILHWQKEAAERKAREEAREEKEARRPWAARKVRRGVRKARVRWVRAVEGLRERVGWDW